MTTNGARPTFRFATLFPDPVDGPCGHQYAEQTGACWGHELELREETFFSSHFARPSAILVDANGMKRAGANPLKPALAAGPD